MLKLLNRFAWIIAILIWIQLGWFISYYFWFYFWKIISGIILWIIIKKLFLSENFIQDRLEFFANSIRNNYIWKEKEVEQKIIHHPSGASFNAKGFINKIEKEVEEDIEENAFMKKLKKIDIEEIKVIRFFPNKSEKFTVRAKNLIRIIKLITDKTGKTTFKSWELTKMYDFIIKNYKSDLSRREYDKIRSTVKDFIDEGGEIEIVKK